MKKFYEEISIPSCLQIVYGCLLPQYNGRIELRLNCGSQIPKYQFISGEKKENCKNLALFPWLVTVLTLPLPSKIKENSIKFESGVTRAKANSSVAHCMKHETTLDSIPRIAKEKEKRLSYFCQGYLEWPTLEFKLEDLMNLQVLH